MKQMKLDSFTKSLSRDEMRSIKGGFVEPPGRCLGCKTDHDCAQVNKGNCKKTCDDGRIGCDAW